MTESGRAWRIAIVEDHLLQRRRTEELLGDGELMRVVHSAESMPEFIDWLAGAAADDRPDLLVLDLMVERGPSVDPVRLGELIDDGLRVVVLSALVSPPLVRQVLQAGVGAIVGKRDSEDDILAAVDEVLHDGHWMSSELAAVIAADAARPKLSVQEERALVLYASGLTLDAVASAIGVKRDTAKQYIERVKLKYVSAGRPVRTKIDLNRVATADGYLDG
ncbi:response regulator [Herbiconiux moechotypicola]|uniref:Response regulator transcription factor n=1 Tax=Herbiconiux moechotypicola TaxID=637393 RepID=A0ABP5QBP8_9MICO|nr:response regulator [Herbiconiux moechotypicola]MCS5729629.1 response regulator [Herbiconiux moechotypicola]